MKMSKYFHSICIVFLIARNRSFINSTRQFLVMNKVEIDNIYFSCPDCETGFMSKQNLGHLTNFLKCNRCETGLYASSKLMKLLSLPYSCKVSETVNISASPHSSNTATQ